jgi:hydroxymethylbilane synthase
MKIHIATRTSKLAMVQTRQIIAELQAKIPDLEIELTEIVTTGDKIQDRSLAELGGKGLFIKGLEEALIAGSADIAMHSLKDVPPNLEPAFCIPAVLARHSPHDALVSEKYSSIDALPDGATVGTSSVRRKAALLRMRPDLNVQMVRGNVDTRLKKLHDGEFDALILAEAGLTRLGFADKIKQVLPLDVFAPSVGQGVIAIECLSTRPDVIEMLKKINNPETFARITAERAMNSALKASCTSPVGSFAEVIDGALHLRGVVWSPDGRQRIETHQSGRLEDAKIVGELAANDLNAKGALELLRVAPVDPIPGSHVLYGGADGSGAPPESTYEPRK